MKPVRYLRSRLWTVLLIAFSLAGWFVPVETFASSMTDSGLTKKLSLEEVHDLFSEAKSYLEKAGEAVARDDSAAAREMYRLALLRFIRITEEGDIKNGKLYYNIANTYFLTNDIGRSILNYRRAERYIQLDSNLRDNLRTARLKRQDRFDLSVKRKVLKTVFFWHYDVNLKTRFILFVVCMDIAWLLAVAGLLWRRFFSIKPLVVIAAVLAGLLFCSVTGEMIARSNWQEGVIINENVIARKGDGEHYNPSFETPLHAGTEFKLLELRGGWWYIELLDGRQCWLPERAVELI